MTESIIPSMNLRFIERIEADPKYIGVNVPIRTVKILQQSFTTSKGQEWRDVPFVADYS